MNARTLETRKGARVRLLEGGADDARPLVFLHGVAGLLDDHTFLDLLAERYRVLAPELPGYGEEKSKIFLAILGKRLGQAAPGWEEAAAPFSDATPRSVADVDSPESLARVREFKQARKAEKKGKAD